MEPFIGEIRMFAGNFAPVGWAFCDGSYVSIADNEALFSLVGTIYGGDGIQSFRLPDLRGRVPLHQGDSQGRRFQIGEQAGSESVTLMPYELPAHTHLLSASTAQPAQSTSPTEVPYYADLVPASPSPKPRMYGAPGAPVAMAENTVSATGGSQPHNNMAPFLAVHFIIAVDGIYPTQY